jgi:hypothetical protein
VDATDFVPLADQYRFMVIARPRDDAVEAREDTTIDKSVLFEITPTRKKLAVTLRNETMNKMIPRGVLQLWVLIVPRAVEVDKIGKINDAIRRGGQVVATPSLIVYPAKEK